MPDDELGQRIRTALDHAAAIPTEEIRVRARRRRRRRAAGAAGSAVVIALAIAIPLSLTARNASERLSTTKPPPSTSGVTVASTVPPVAPTSLPATPPAVARTLPPTSARSTTSTTATTATTPPATTTPSTTEGSCPTGHLGITVTGPDAGAGNVFYQLTFTNLGPTTCDLDGYPGVSVLDAKGAPIDEPLSRQPATRAGRPLPEADVTLDPGATATAAFDLYDPSVATCSTQADATTVKVYPPGQVTARLVPLVGPEPVCGDGSQQAPGYVESVQGAGG